MSTIRAPSNTQRSPMRRRAFLALTVGVVLASFGPKAAAQLTEGTCACGESPTVLQELTAFVEQFPTARITPDIRRRIEALKSGTSNIHFKCSPA